MYTFSNKLRNLSIALMLVGFLGLVYGFLSAPQTVEEAKAMVATAHHGAGHGEEHAAASHHEASASHAEDTHGSGHEAADHSEGHDSSHDEHLLHQLQNKPWAALYVAAFFFFMISLGVLAF